MTEISKQLISAKKFKLHKLFSSKKALFWAAGFAAVVAVMLIFVNASTTTNIIEPESATLSLGAVLGDDPAAAGGAYILFGGSVQSTLGGDVAITSAGFIPATIGIKAGQSVTWTNQDAALHQIASDPYPLNNTLPELLSDPLNNGESFSFTFEQAGTFTYHDEQNPLTILGTVIVQ